MSKNAAWFVNRVIYFLIKDPKAANSLVNHLVTTPKDVIILPFIDHPGPISQEILSRNFRSLSVCERDPELNQKFDVSYFWMVLDTFTCSFASSCILTLIRLSAST